MAAEESAQNGLRLVVLAWQDMGCLNELMERGDGRKALTVNSSLEDGKIELVVERGHDREGVRLLAINAETEDSDTAGAVVLLHSIDTGLQLQNLVVFVFH